MAKYNETDGLTTLESVDDAATATDSGCRMPTEDECEELMMNTSSEWVDDYNGTGVAGRVFTSNVNSNSIFVPAAGICDNGIVHVVGQGACLWSSSLSSSGVRFAFYLDSAGDVDYDGRCIGLPVRPVKL